MVRSDGPPRRAGHSLPELIVAVTILAVAFGGIAASTHLGGRWTRDSLRRQTAIRAATEVLDSLSLVAEPEAGERQTAGLRMVWASSGAGGDLLVTALTPAGDTLFHITGRSLPPIPVLPEPAPAPRAPPESW